MFFRTFFLLAYFSANISWAAQQKVILISSLNLQAKTCLCLRVSFEHYVPNLETIFRKNFEGSNYQVEIHQSADQFTLWNALHDPLAIAVFWISHAGSSPDPTSGVFGFHKILDAGGHDVTPLFGQIHPNLRFLAIIGCFSKDVMRSMTAPVSDPAQPHNPYLRVLSFSKKVDATRGLKEALVESKKILEIPEIRLGFTMSCPKTIGYPLRLDRSFTEDLTSIRPAARIMSKRYVVGVFPEGNQPQHLEAFLPKTEEALPDLSLDVGENAQILRNPSLIERLNIGLLSGGIQGPGDPIMPWHRWQGRDGNPIGIFSHGYKVLSSDGEPEALSQYLREGSEFECPPMPSYESPLRSSLTERE